MGDNTDNQLGISQRGKSEDPVLQLNAPARIHLSAHSRAAKPVQVSCGASHTAAVTGQSNAVPPGDIENMLHLNLRLGLKTSFTLWKRIKCFPFTFRRRSLETQQIPGNRNV